MRQFLTCAVACALYLALLSPQTLSAAEDKLDAVYAGLKIRDIGPQ